MMSPFRNHSSSFIVYSIIVDAATLVIRYRIPHEEPCREFGQVKRMITFGPFPLSVKNKESIILYVTYYSLMTHFLPNIIIKHPDYNSCKIEIGYSQVTNWAKEQVIKRSKGLRIRKKDRKKFYCNKCAKNELKRKNLVNH